MFDSSESLYPLGQKVAPFFCEGQTSQHLGFLGSTAFAATTELSCGPTNAAIDKT